MLTKENRRQIQLTHDYAKQAKNCLTEVIFCYLSAGERIAIDQAFHEIDSAVAKTANLLDGLYDGSKRETKTRQRTKRQKQVDSGISR